MPSPRLRLRLILTTDTVWDMPAMEDTDTDTVWDTPHTDTVLDTDTDTDTVWDTVATSDTARGPLMPSPRLRLRLIPTTDTDTVLDMPDTAVDTMVDTVLDTVVVSMDIMDKSSLHFLIQAQQHQDLSVNHQLPCQHQMDYFSLSFVPHQCCQFQCCQASSTSNGKQEARESKSYDPTNKKRKL